MYMGINYTYHTVSILSIGVFADFAHPLTYFAPLSTHHYHHHHHLHDHDHDHDHDSRCIDIQALGRLFSRSHCEGISGGLVCIGPHDRDLWAITARTRDRTNCSRVAGYLRVLLLRASYYPFHMYT